MAGPNDPVDVALEKLARAYHARAHSLCGVYEAHLTDSQANAWYAHAVSSPEWAALREAEIELRYRELQSTAGACDDFAGYRDAALAVDAARRAMREVARLWVAALVSEAP